MSNTALRARVVLNEMEAMGLTIDDLLAVAGGEQRATAGPTVAEYVLLVAAAYKPRSRRTYNSYWSLMVEMVGDVALERVTIDHLVAVVEEAGRRAAARRPGSEGRASRETCVAAARAVFTRAVKAGLISTNPALLVDKPRRLVSRRRALDQAELKDLWEAVAATTPDPELDLLLLRFHLESGARRMGAIKLRLRDVDPDRQTIWLREKFGAEREQPISRTLLDALTEHAAARGARAPDDSVLYAIARTRCRPTPLSDRTYDRIFTRAQSRVEWAQRTPLTAHVLRYTAITAVERIAGFAVAQAFAGHQPSSVTGSYAKAGIGEVAEAVARLTGEEHPLASASRGGE